MPDTPEHEHLVNQACVKYFGDVIWFTVIDSDDGKSYPFNLGQVSALAGDFYGTVDDMRKDAKFASEWLNNDEIRDLVRTQGELGIELAIKMNGRRFLQLAVSNHSHFRLGKPTQNQNALESCRYFHDMARSSTDQSVALLYEGFALHFLVDLFASGHMRTPRYAFEQFLALPKDRGGLGYSSRNAEIVGSLLALIQHDSDNSHGLECDWELFDNDPMLPDIARPDAFRHPRSKSQQRLRYPSDGERWSDGLDWMYWGDNAIKRGEMKGGRLTNARKHLNACIASMVIDSLRSSSSKPPAVSAYLPYFLEAGRDWSEIIWSSIPTPFPGARSEHNRNNRLFCVLGYGDNKELVQSNVRNDAIRLTDPVIVCNFSAPKGRPFDVKEKAITVTVFTGDSPLTSGGKQSGGDVYPIIKITVQILKDSYWVSAVLMAWGSVSPLTVPLPAWIAMPHDGGSSVVLQLFDVVNLGADCFAFGSTSRPPDR